MKEQVGKVTLNYEFYSNVDLYSDGPIEDTLLDIAQAGQMKDALNHSEAWPILYHFSSVRQHILEWFPMKEHANVLEVGSGCGAITGILSKMAERVVCIELSKQRSLINANQNCHCDNVEIYVGNYEDITLTEKFDYITLIGVLEYSEYYTHGENTAITMLEQLKGMLKPGGKILIAIENRMGLKYMNGANEDHTGILFDGLNYYNGKKGARTYTKPELEQILNAAGLSSHKFYYPFPDYKMPRMIYTDNSNLQPGMFVAAHATFDRTRYEFFNEEMVWNTLSKDGLSGYFANSFFVEASINEAPEDIESVIYSFARNQEYQTKTTIINSDNEHIVKKTPMCHAGVHHINAFIDKYTWLSGIYNNVEVVPVKLESDGAVFPYIDGTNLNTKLLQNCQYKDYLIENVTKYLDRILSFKEDALTAFYETEEFQTVFGHTTICDGVPAVKFSNIDGIFSNIIEKDDKLYMYDYEWVFPFPVPIRFIRFRMLLRWYACIEHYLPYDDPTSFLEDFGFTNDELIQYDAMEYHFLNYCKNANQTEYDYLNNYYKIVIPFADLEKTIGVQTEQLNQRNAELTTMRQQNDLLQKENAELKQTLERHIKNEERLRRHLRKQK